MRYKSVGGGFDSRWCHWNSLNLSGYTMMALGLTQPLTEISTRNISWPVLGLLYPVRGKKLLRNRPEGSDGVEI
jgi:hypothetical protein